MTTIKNLAFKGGGVLGIAYAGAIKVLETNNILPQIEKVAGTSAGAITATLVSLNYTADEIQSIVNSTSFSTFEDDKSILRIPFKYGLYAGDALLAWVKSNITKKGLSENATFRDFHNFTDGQNQKTKDLYVFASDLNLQSLKVFSFATTPDVIVAEAVRASMSIPMFFEAWKFSNNAPDDHIYVDGGLIYNYPITHFDTGGEPNPETLGFYLANLQAIPKPNDLSFDKLLSYVKITFETSLDAQSVLVLNDPEQVKRSVFIDDLGISGTNFNLTKEQEDALYQSGLNATQAYLAKMA
jgi:NTE family protein